MSASSFLSDFDITSVEEIINSITINSCVYRFVLKLRLFVVQMIYFRYYFDTVSNIKSDLLLRPFFGYLSGHSEDFLPCINEF